MNFVLQMAAIYKKRNVIHLGYAHTLSTLATTDFTRRHASVYSIIFFSLLWLACLFSKAGICKKKKKKNSSAIRQVLKKKS